MVEIKNTDNISKIIGEVDIATAKQFEKAITDLLEVEDLVVLDMTDMDYIDSTGMGILMNLKKNVLGENQDIVLYRPKRSIQKLFQLTGIDQVFKIEK